MDPLITLTIIFLLGCFLALSWFAGTDAPYVPSKMKAFKKILPQAGVKKGVCFYELGSGDGRVVLEASRLGAQAHGVEQSWVRVWQSRYQAYKHHLPNASFFHGNIFDRSYYPAGVVYIYLLPQAVQKLEKKLKAELNPGAVVITQTYHFKNWEPFKRVADFWLYRV